jgi:Lipid A 3-O-deacylase (PagL).
MRAFRNGLLAAALGGLFSAFPFPNVARAEPSPDLISVGIGAYDSVVFQPSVDTPRNRSADFRLEYRFGYSLLSFTEPYVKFRPWVGFETTTDGMLYGAGGILADVQFGPVVFTPSFGAGLWRRGGSKNLGAGVEFRSMVELGYEFDNQMRVSAFLSHISNGGITRKNPGVNTAGAYLHIPFRTLFGTP